MRESSTIASVWFAVAALTLTGKIAGEDKSLFMADPFSVKGFCSCCTSSPLVLDLQGVGMIYTTGLENSVQFDINGDSIMETMGWTSRWGDMGFLWLDLNGNGVADNGRELFGTATLLPQGGSASNGFEALKIYDSPENGGNGDDLINNSDQVWGSLKLWIDWSHDAVSQPEEIFSLEDYQVASILLEYEEEQNIDGSLNNHLFKGIFLREVILAGIPAFQLQLIEDVVFVLDTDSDVIEEVVFIDNFESGNTLAWSQTCIGCPEAAR